MRPAWSMSSQIKLSVTRSSILPIYTVASLSCSLKIALVNCSKNCDSIAYQCLAPDMLAVSKQRCIELDVVVARRVKLDRKYCLSQQGFDELFG